MDEQERVDIHVLGYSGFRMLLLLLPLLEAVWVVEATEVAGVADGGSGGQRNGRGGSWGAVGMLVLGAFILLAFSVIPLVTFPSPASGPAPFEDILLNMHISLYGFIELDKQLTMTTKGIFPSQCSGVSRTWRKRDKKERKVYQTRMDGTYD